MDRIVAEYVLVNGLDNFRLQGEVSWYTSDQIVDHPNWPNVSPREFAEYILPAGNIVIEAIDGQYDSDDIAALADFCRDGYLSQLKSFGTGFGCFLRLDASTMDCIACFTTLEALDLSNAAGLSPNVVAKIRSLRHLKRLNLSETDIDDTAAINLRELAMLEKLIIQHTDISTATIHQLRVICEAVR